MALQKQKFAFYYHDASFNSEDRVTAKENKAIVFLKESGIVWTNDTSFGGNDTIYAIKNHASSTNAYGLGTAFLYGHVKLSNATGSTSGEDDGIAATPYAVNIAYNLADEKWKWNDASIKKVKVDDASQADFASHAGRVDGSLRWSGYTSGWYNGSDSSTILLQDTSYGFNSGTNEFTVIPYINGVAQSNKTVTVTPSFDVKDNSTEAFGWNTTYKVGSVDNKDIYIKTPAFALDTPNYGVITDGNKNIVAADLSFSMTAVSGANVVRGITQNSKGQITAVSTSAITAADLGLTNALVFKGVTTTPITDGSTTNPIIINGVTTSVEGGNIVIRNDTNKEFIWVPATGGVSTAHWTELGDEGSYALKTIKIEGVGGLTGGGTLESNREISLRTITGETYSGTTASGAWKRAKIDADGSVYYYAYNTNTEYTSNKGISQNGTNFYLTQVSGNIPSDATELYAKVDADGSIKFCDRFHTPTNTSSSNSLKIATGSNGASDMYVQYATTEQYGVTKLYDGVNSDSSSLAATANATKTAYAAGITAQNSLTSHINEQFTPLVESLTWYIV